VRHGVATEAVPLCEIIDDPLTFRGKLLHMGGTALTLEMARLVSDQISNLEIICLLRCLIKCREW
jgi:hypothetical protein